MYLLDAAPPLGSRERSVPAMMRVERWREAGPRSRSARSSTGRSPSRPRDPGVTDDLGHGGVRAARRHASSMSYTPPRTGAPRPVDGWERAFEPRRRTARPEPRPARTAARMALLVRPHPSSGERRLPGEPQPQALRPRGHTDAAQVNPAGQATLSVPFPSTHRITR